MRITINAGHMPGTDPGAVGPNGVREADVNKSVALTVVELLVSAGHEVQFVQSDSLAEICELSNEYGSNVFISSTATPPITRQHTAQRPGLTMAVMRQTDSRRACRMR